MILSRAGKTNNTQQSILTRAIFLFPVISMLFILLELVSLMVQIFIVVASYESNARQITSRGGTKEDLRIKRKEKRRRERRDPPAQ